MRVVVKIGTSSITADNGEINATAIAKLCDEVAVLRATGHQAVIVSSGAVAAGLEALGFDQRPADILTLQAVSAVGQSRLIRHYNDELARHSLVGAQVLVDPFDFVDRSQYLHARRTLERLLELGCVPILNENDAIASDELRYGDNDRIAALIAHTLRADRLVLLTDAEGLYTADPRTDQDARLIENVAADDELLRVDVSHAGSGRGSGGMASKLAAARIASWSGVECVIAKASRPNVVVDAVTDQGAGTRFAAHDRRMSARRLWIAFASEISGSLIVDDGARDALTQASRSLLPAGIREVRGDFDAGVTVDVTDQSGEVFARGRVRATSAEIAEVLGLRSEQLPDTMVSEVIHRDELVLIPR